MPPSDFDEEPPQAALVEPLLPTTAPTEEAAIISLIPEEESPFVGTSESSSPTREPELLVLSVDDSAWEHGEGQELKFQNLFFGFLFVAQAITLLVFGVHAMTFASSKKDDTNDPSQDDDDDNGDMDWNFILYYTRHFLFAFLGTMVSIIALSATTLSYLLRQTGATRRMIEISLIFAPISYALSSIGAMAAGMIPMAGIFLLFGLISTCYVISVWKRIPVAAANLAVAMTAVKAHQGSLMTLGYTLTLVAASWTCMWVLAVGDIGMRDSSFFWECQGASSPEQDPSCSVTSGGVCLGLLLLLSLLWTIQVIKNLCHTTVAGVVGSWWFSAPSSSTNDEEEAAADTLIPGSSPRKVVYDSWVRASVYSFGSICFGSLVVGILQVLQFIVRCGRQQQDRRNRGSSASLVLCICQCIVDQLERLAEYLNKWAFVYVGLYGYDYWTAGSKVYNLFKARGWSVILNDHLINRYLTLLQTILSLLSGVICQFWGWLLVIRPLSAAHRRAAENDPDNTDDPVLSVLWYSFFSIGFVLGMNLSGVLFRLVSSAVDTIVVCFAEAPNQLSVLAQQRQPRPMLKPSLANEMILSWRQVYPQECGF